MTATRVGYAVAAPIAVVAIGTALTWVFAVIVPAASLLSFPNGGEVTVRDDDGSLYVETDDTLTGVHSDVSAAPDTRCTATDFNGESVELERYFNASINENASVARLPDELRGKTITVSCSGDYDTLLIGPYVPYGVFLFGLLWGFVLPVALLGLAIPIAVTTFLNQQPVEE